MTIFFISGKMYEIVSWTWYTNTLISLSYLKFYRSSTVSRHICFITFFVPVFGRDTVGFIALRLLFRDSETFDSTSQRHTDTKQGEAKTNLHFPTFLCGDGSWLSPKWLQRKWLRCPVVVTKLSLLSFDTRALSSLLVSSRLVSLGHWHSRTRSPTPGRQCRVEPRRVGRPLPHPHPHDAATTHSQIPIVNSGPRTRLTHHYQTFRKTGRRIF